MLLIGIIAGFYIGSYVTMVAVAEVASNYIDIDHRMVDQAIHQYREQIGGCIQTENALIYNNTGD